MVVFDLCTLLFHVWAYYIDYYKYILNTDSDYLDLLLSNTMSELEIVGFLDNISK